MNKWMKICLASMLVATVSAFGMCFTYSYTSENNEYGPTNFEGVCKFTFCAYADQQRFCAGFASSGHEGCYDVPYMQDCNVHTASADSEGNCPSPYQDPEEFEFSGIEGNEVHWDALFGAACTDA
jgi:hypothetical protein